MTKIFKILFFLITFFFFTSKAVLAENSVTILNFQKFNENKSPATNIKTEQLDYLINYLKINDYSVISLSEALEKVENDTSLPAKTVVLTIDNGYKSVYTIAYPKFKKAGFPFTVFVSTDNVNNNNSQYMNWTQIKELAKNGVSIQSYSKYRKNYARLSSNNVELDIQRSIMDILINTGIKPTIFAYPFGDARLTTMRIVERLGLKAGMGNFSGVFNKTSNKYYIPRFFVNEKYSTEQRFRTILNVKSFPIANLKPVDPNITANNPPVITFKALENTRGLKGISCYSSSTVKSNVEVKNSTVKITFNGRLKTGRMRINCTLPSISGNYMWLGMQFIVL